MKKIILALMLTLSFNAAYAIPAMHSSDTQSKPEYVKKELNVFQKVKVEIFKWNMYINKEVPKYMRSLKNEPSLAVIFAALFAAFIYGIVHTLGPGHGKMVVATYFLTNNASFWQGVLLGLQMAFAHVGGAVILVLTTDIALRTLVLNPEQHMFLLKSISFSLIILVGLAMLIQAILHATGKVKSKGCSHCAKHNHSHDHIHDHSVKNTKKDTGIALAIGLVPCTGSLLILLYAMANNIMVMGLLMVVFVAIGMALTMILLGVLAILGKKKILDKFFKSEKTGHKYSLVLEVLGALFIIAIGSVLLWANL